jgi:thymidylate synthase
MNNLDKQYTALLQDILDNGHQKGDRTGTGTISVFGRQIRHRMSEGFPLITTKKMYTKGIVTELLWFLRGETNIKFLVENDCNIWNGDAYKRFYNETQKGLDSMFLKNEGPNKIVPFTQEEFVNKIKTDDEFAKKWGELGPVYGKQWRSWTKYVEQDYEPHWEIKIDQIANVINDLRTNPDSRRIIVSAWNVGEIDQMTLPPCHNFFQFYTRELSYEERYNWYINTYNKNLTRSSNQFDMDDVLNTNNTPIRAISLMWNQRSVDTFLGLPFNIASYGLLLEIIAKAVNMVPEELIGNLGDTHLYSNHIEQAKEQIGRELSLKEQALAYNDTLEKQNYNPKWQSKIENIDNLSENELMSILQSKPCPKRTREPYPLPTLKINSGNENWNLLEIDEIINSLDTDITFKVENYQSHPTIKAPLSN